MAKSDSKDDLPTFEVVHQDNEANEKCQLNDIDEANSFWINLWEKEGQGNANAEWLQEISSAFARNVPSSSERDCRLDAEAVEKALVNKKNWGVPGLDKIVNYWWKKSTVVHKDMEKAFQAIIEGSHDLPQWFSEGRTILMPMPGNYTSDNQRPITCLNTTYKWFPSCLLPPTVVNISA